MRDRFISYVHNWTGRDKTFSIVIESYRETLYNYSVCVGGLYCNAPQTLLLPQGTLKGHSLEEWICQNAILCMQGTWDRHVVGDRQKHSRWRRSHLLQHFLSTEHVWLLEVCLLARIWKIRPIIKRMLALSI